MSFFLVGTKLPDSGFIGISMVMDNLRDTIVRKYRRIVPRKVLAPESAELSVQPFGKLYGNGFLSSFRECRSMGKGIKIPDSFQNGWKKVITPEPLKPFSEGWSTNVMIFLKQELRAIRYPFQAKGCEILLPESNRMSVYSLMSILSLPFQRPYQPRQSRQSR